MLYLSKGMLQESLRGTVTVNRYGRLFKLRGTQAQDWFKGHTAPQYLGRVRLQELERQGLVEVQPGKDFIPEMFSALYNCILAPRNRACAYWGLSAKQRRLLRWIREAGLRLTAAELVRITELGLDPMPGYLGPDNRQRLVEAIYNTENILDGALESQMAQSPALAETIGALLGLIKKRRVILL